MNPRILTVKLPKGSRIEMRYVYDNSASNPHNPSNPPKTVRFGEQTTDEMGLAFLQWRLPGRDDVRPFRRQMLLSRIEQVVAEGDDFSGLNRCQAAWLPLAVAMFDANHQGKLDAEERARFMKFNESYIK